VGLIKKLKAGDKAVPVDFVEAPPPPPPAPIAVPEPEKKEPELATAPTPTPGNAATPKKGPGEYKPEEIKKPDAAAAKTPQIGKKAPPKKLVRRAVRVDAAKLAEQARRRAEKLAALTEARIEAARIKEEKLRRAREAAAELAERRAAEARERAARVQAEREERARLAAEARALQARRKAELNQRLASLAGPDEELHDAVADTGSRVGPIAGVPRGRGTLEAAVARPGGDPAALDDAAEPVYEIAREGSASADKAATGGGLGPDGMAWTLDGPVGNRALLRRPLPSAPEWLGKRGLEVAVQIRFQVAPSGLVKPGAVIKKTSGFPEIDKKALDALKGWRFAAVKASRDVWGQVTFRFQMQ